MPSGAEARPDWFPTLSEAREGRQLLEHLRAVITEFDENGHTVRVSSSSQAVLGYAPDELIGAYGRGFVHPEDLEATTPSRYPSAAQQAERTYVHRARHADGHWVWLETSTTRPFLAEDGAPHSMAFSRDVTREKEAEDAVRESAERYSVAIEANDDSIIENDMDGRVQFTTPNAGASLGYAAEALAELSPFALVHPDDVEPLRGQLRDAVDEDAPTRLAAYRARHRDGSWRWLQSTGIAYTAERGHRRFLNVTRDITDLLEVMQDQIDRRERGEQRDRLERLGTMAGAMAHDFNNLLTPILGETKLALEELPATSAIRSRLERIIETASRAAEMVRPMLGYLGAEEIDSRPVGLSSLASDVVRIFESTPEVARKLRFDLDAEDPSARGDPGRLVQVFMNLVSNAAEASSGPGATIFIRTGRARLDGDTAVLRPEGAGDEDLYSFLEVEDRGTGMAPAVLTRIFEPFFTTKPSGRGLGLASVLGILRSHGGGVEVESALGKGTRVRALLPSPDLGRGVETARGSAK